MRELKILRQVTPRSIESVNTYLSEISKTPLLTIDDEIELAQRIRNGDSDALQKLVNANLRFAFSVAKQYQNQGLELPDLINEANSGLIEAAERFDETRGFKFISYAVNWVRQSILKALAEQTRNVYVPMNHQRTLKVIDKIQERNFTMKGDVLSIEELSEVSGFTVVVIMKAISAFGHKETSLNRSFNDIEGANCLLDVLIDSDSLSPEKNLIDQSLRIDIEKMLSTLKEREEYVLRNIYGIGCVAKSKEEIANKIGVDIPRLHQLLLEIKRKIKNSHRGDVLRTYFDLIN
ncbi:MAG: sigma-70 family RNA polymerase sigma factor [Candidatus Nomurabacteria bacterium]